MMMLAERRRWAAALGAAGLGAAWLVATAGLAAGADASRWDGDARNAVRLIAGGPARSNAPLRAGIEIRLAAGWHTYWRYPGDAGVPPRFDFAGSQNVKAVDVHWPAPQRLPEQAVTVIGYTGDLILPLSIVPQDRGKPVMLRLKIDYAVCEKLCVPAEGKAELVLGDGPSAQDGALLAAEARVPKKVAPGEGSPLAITSVRREDASPRPRVVVDVAAPAGETVALFAEGPTPEWALPVPAPVAGAPAGLQRFAFELDGAPSGQGYDGIALTLTARAGDRAIEVATRLD